MTSLQAATRVLKGGVWALPVKLDLPTYGPSAGARRPMRIDRADQSYAISATEMTRAIGGLRSLFGLKACRAALKESAA